MIGEFGFHIVGTVCGGPGQLGKALGMHPSLVVNVERRLADHLVGRSSKSTDPDQRMKESIDHFQRACWRAAGEHGGKKWGRVTLTEHIAEFVDSLGGETKVDAGWRPIRGKSNPVDYFICRCLRIPTIFIVRDGRTCIPAKMQHQKVALSAATARWRFSIYVLKRMVQFTEHLLVVRVEDLLADPPKEMSAICNFLGVGLRKELLGAIEQMRANFPLVAPGDVERISKEPWTHEIASDLVSLGYTITEATQASNHGQQAR